MEKKQWQKPELIVLVRNKPEEQVLNACKTAGTNTGWLNHNDSCYSDSTPCATNCSDTTES
jgi:hypothetical protein